MLGHYLDGSVLMGLEVTRNLDTAYSKIVKVPLSQI